MARDKELERHNAENMTIVELKEFQKDFLNGMSLNELRIKYNCSVKIAIKRIKKEC